MRDSIHRLALLVLLGGGVGAVAAEPAPPPPNVLLIAVDDLRPDLACDGVDWMKTPNLDRLARRSRLFRRHYVQVATCGASRYSLLTGRRPSGDADYGNEPFPAHRDDLAARPTESLVHAFRRQGYRTVAIGKVSHDPDDSAVDLPRSWDEVVALRGPWHLSVRAFAAPVDPAAYPPFESAEVADTTYPDGVLAEQAIEQLRQFAGRPFFLALGFYKPHLPFNAPRRYWDLYDADAIPPPPAPELPAGVDATVSLHPSFELVEQYGGMPAGALDREEYRRRLRHGYAAAVSFVDAQIGKVLDELERQGLDDDTIVIVWGDHGWHLGDLGIWGKHTAFERALRSPLIVRLPGMPAPGTATDGLVESLDIYPTLVELCHLPHEDGLAGRSFAALLRDPAAPGSERVFGYHRPWRHPGPVVPWAKTQRTDRYRCTVWTTQRDGGALVAGELYDHRSDPEETANLFDRRPDVVADLLGHMPDDGLPWRIDRR